MVRWSGRGRILAILVCLVAWNTARADERAAAQVYEKLQASNGLEAFFRAFPKGGDLHNHMSAGITPQQWMDIAIKRNFCVDEQLPALVQNLESACPAGLVPAATLRNGGPVSTRFIESMSMRDRQGRSKGHDYFFENALGHVRIPAPDLVWGDEIETVVLHASEQNIAYLELQIGFLGGADFGGLAASLPAEGSLAGWLDVLDKSPVLPGLIERNQRRIQRFESELVERRPAEAAAVQRRYLITTGRGEAPRSLFLQLAVVAELARVEPRVVGMNLAGPEDGAVSLRDFRLQMGMIDFIRSRKPWLRIALHAGELTPQILGAAPGTVPETLTFHIAESVWNGHAERIGHGTDLRYEKDRAKLLRAMRERGVLAEICLTSEELIQGLKPDEIPFAAYRQAGVPVSLNTDDEGVFGSDLSEFVAHRKKWHLMGSAQF